MADDKPYPQPTGYPSIEDAGAEDRGQPSHKALERVGRCFNPSFDNA